MAKMLISPNRSREISRQRGATLIELIIVIAIIAIGAAIAASPIRPNSPQRQIDFSLKQIEQDLKLSRATARLQGRDIYVVTTPNGYAIPGLKIDRAISPKIEIVMNSSFGDKILFSPSKPSFSIQSVKLTTDSIHGQIDVLPLTNKVERNVQ